MRLEKIAHPKKFHDLHSLSCIVRVFKFRRMRTVGQVAYTGEEKNACRLLIGKPEGKYHLGNLGIDGRVVLKWILKKYDGSIWTRLM